MKEDARDFGLVGVILGVRATGITARPLRACTGPAHDPKSAQSRSESGMRTRGAVRRVLQVGSCRSGSGGMAHSTARRSSGVKQRTASAGGKKGRRREGADEWA